ncbi:MAG: transposase [bacterium]|nr:transposase [bacterium]
MEWRDRVREEGREEGQLAGEALILTRQLQLKFGPLADATRQTIAGAESKTLLRWADRVLTAASLSDVFDDD